MRQHTDVLFLTFLLLCSYAFSTPVFNKQSREDNVNIEMSSQTDNSESEVTPRSYFSKETNLISQTSANTSKGQCNNGFGFKGRCINSTTFLNSLPLPDGTAKKIINGFVIPFIVSATGAAELCYGDYSGSFITNGAEKLSTFTCNAIPVDTNFNYGVIGGVLRNVPCGTPQTVSACVLFDKCGTFAIGINGGVAQCLATYSTGIAAILGPLAGTLKYANIAFSLKRRLTKSFSVAAIEGNALQVVDVTTRGHLFFGLGITLPLNFLKIKGKSLGDYIQFEADLSILLDFGSLDKTVEKWVNKIIHPSSFSPKEFIKDIMNSGAEVTAIVQGLLVIQFEEMTNGFLHDFGIELGSASLLITTGNGSSGREPGIYFYATSDILSGLMSAFEGVFNHFSSILGALGFKKPKLPKINMRIGLAIQKSGVGFIFDFPILTVKCIYKFGGKGASCKFGSAIFTAIVDGAKWVIKQAKKLFDKAGKEICKVAKGVGKFASSAAKEVKKFFQNSGKALKMVANQAGKAIGGAAKKAGKAIKNEFNKAGNKIKSGLNKAGNKIKGGLKKAGNKVKNFFKSIFTEDENEVSPVEEVEETEEEN